MSKIDLKKSLGPLYRASARRIDEIDVPEQRFLSVTGTQGPASQAFAEAVEALFSVSYTAKFMLKKAPEGVDYGVMPLEALWWADDMSAFTAGDKSAWQWTAMILQPEFVGPDLLADAMSEVARKKNLPAMDRLSVVDFTEGHCAQILHVGPFSEEGPTVARLHEYIDTRSGRSGKHHEIYLSDIRRADASRWRTIIRHPMQSAPGS